MMNIQEIKFSPNSSRYLSNFKLLTHLIIAIFRQIDLGKLNRHYSESEYFIYEPILQNWVKYKRTVK